MKSVLSRIQQYVQSNSALARVTRNISWITAEKAIRMLVGLFVMSMLARHLGPEDFGLLSLGIAIISMFIPFTELGLQGVIIKAHVEKPQEIGSIVGTALALRMIGALATAALAIGATLLFPTEDSRLLLIVAILCFVPSFRVSDSFKHIFEARVFSRPVTFAELAACLTSNALRLGAIIGGFSVIYFAFIQSIEFAIGAVCMIATYRYHIGRLSELRVSFSRSVEFLKLGWPLLLSSIAVVIYMKIDQLMLGMMLGEAEVGIYSLAARISEIWYFVPGAIAYSTFPFLIESKNKDPAFYIRRLIRLLRSLIILACCVAIVISLSSNLLVSLLFGPDYKETSNILPLHTWGGIFASLSIVTRYWAINENLQYLEIVRTISGALLNILLNLYLIPAHGLLGAAYATLLSQVWSGILFDLIHPATREIFKHKLFAACIWRSI